VPQTTPVAPVAESAESADRRTFEDALASGFSANKRPAEGDLVSGVVAAITPDVVLVSLGGKSDALMDLAELEGEKVGDRIEAVVIKASPDIRLSRRMAAAKRTRAELRVAATARIPVEGKVVSRNKGGFEVMLGGAGGLRAFCPVSQIDVGRHDEAALTAYIGQSFDFRIVEYSDDGKRVVVSRAALLREAHDAESEKARANVVVGAVLTGKVRSLTDFGAFVDLGGVDGLVHVTEISRRRVGNPKEALTVGQEVTVRVTKVEQDGKRISLSMKEFEKDPWEGLTERLAAGASFSGKVARHADFGLFVEIEPGVDGLVHVSQLPPGLTLKDPSVAVGQVVNGWIREVDGGARRLSLTLREVSTKDPWDGIEARLPEGSTVTGEVENVATFGVFVRLEAGLTGLIPNSETGQPRGAMLSRTFMPGQKVEARIIGLDTQRRRISLSMTAPKDEADRSDVKRYKEEAAKREKPEPGKVSGLGSALLDALNSGKPAKTTR